MESSDKLNELFADGNQFTLHRLLSDIGINDMNIDMTDLVKFDPMKLLDVRIMSKFLSGKKLVFFLLSNYEITIEREKTLSLPLFFYSYHVIHSIKQIQQMIFNQIVLIVCHRLPWLVHQGHSPNYIH
jgi:hypothetical protein